VISIVIPTLNEELALPATLASVFDQQNEHEIIVVDGGSDDETLTIVETAAARHRELRVLVADRGRARQLNAGAAAAGGDWLLFLHADTVLPQNALRHIAGLPETVAAGCFRHRFSGGSPVLRTLSWFHNRRFQVTRVIYGDQAMFVRRPLFLRLGGFPMTDMEDIAFSLALRSATRPIMLSESVITDARKFDQMGHWRALAHAVALLVRFRLGNDVSRDRFFGDYR
jgi:rSAM/selenodomain-associated transferase 2